MTNNRGLTAGTRRIATLAIGVCVLTSALVLGGASGAEVGPAPEAEKYVVGFETWPGYEVGDSYRGGTIYHVDDTLKFIGVRSSDSSFKSGAHTDVNVRYVTYDLEFETQFTPNDPEWDKLYGMRQIRADQVWDLTLGDGDAAVCIVDTGVRYTHEDLADRWLGGYDFVNDDADPWDDHGHGTHVAGTAAGATNNSVGVAGVGQVGIYGVKVLSASGSGSFTDVGSGIRWCADNTVPNTVISMSLGGAWPSPAVKEAVQHAGKQGKLVVAAAGNAWCNPCVGFPAAYEEVMAVACTTSQEERCFFSSQGPEAEVAAPGYGTKSTYSESDSSYAVFSGTSMSTPHVSGLAALYWSYNTAIGADDLRVCLQNTVQDLGTSGRDAQFGYGEVDAVTLFERCGTGSPPPLDDFATAHAFTGLPATYFQNTHNATLEAGEPQPCGNVGSTIWFAYTPTYGGTIHATTAGSGFDTVLAAYSGTSLADLQNLACGDDHHDTAQSAIEFDVQPGVTYYFQAGGKDGAVGSLDLEITCTLCEVPANDGFADALAVTDEPFGSSIRTDHATLEASEPRPCGGAIDATVWYRWTSPENATVSVDTFNSRFDTILGVYTGPGLGDLTLVDCKDDSAGTYQSRVEFTATTNETYYFQVGGYDGETGALEFHLQCEQCMTEVQHDEPENAISIMGTPYSHVVNTDSATEDARDWGCANPGHTVWYKIRATRAGTMTVDTAGSDFDTVLTVRRGGSTGGNYFVGCNDDVDDTVQSRISFSTNAGQTYWIKAGGFYEDSGELHLNVACDPECLPPNGVANDDIGDPFSIDLVPFSQSRSTVGATMQPGEDDCGGTLGASVWYTYTPNWLGGGVYSVDTEGSGYDTVIQVHARVLGQDVSLGCDDNSGSGGTSKVTFVGMPFTQYYFQVGGYDGAQGDLQVNVNKLV